MIPAIALSKLNPHAMRLDQVNSQKPFLMPEDVAASLAGCNRLACDLVLYKYTADEAVISRLLVNVASMVISVAEKLRIDDLDSRCPDTLLRFVKLLVDEFVADGRHKACNGTGIYQYRVCKGCGGTGKKPSSSNYLAKRLMISRYCYLKDWENLLERCSIQMIEYERLALSHIDKQINE